MTMPSDRSGSPGEGHLRRVPTLAAGRHAAPVNPGRVGVTLNGLRQPGALRTVVVAFAVALPALVLRVWAIDTLSNAGELARLIAS